MTDRKFSEEVDQILVLSREEAIRLNHEYIGTEHLLLGIIRYGESSANRVLQNMNVNLPAIQQTVMQTVKVGSSSYGPDYPFPYTTRTKQVFDLSVEEARLHGKESAGPEHLLMGLIREGRGVAGQILNHFGATEDATRAEIARMVS